MLNMYPLPNKNHVFQCVVEKLSQAEENHVQSVIREVAPIIPILLWNDHESQSLGPFHL